MEQLESLPEEFVQPLLSCFGLLKKFNILVFDNRLLFWRFLPYFYLLPSLVVHFLVLTIYFIEVFKEGNVGLDELIYAVPIYVICVQIIFKAAIVTSNKKNIKSIIIRLGNLWRTEKLSKVQISKKNVMLKRLNFCYAAFFWTNMIGAWHYVLEPLFEVILRRYVLHQNCELMLPFRCSFPFDPTSSWPVYLMTYLFQIYCMITLEYCYLGSEFLLIILCSHLTTEFTMLQEDILYVKPKTQNISHVGETDARTRNSDICADENKDLKEFIRRHQTLIRLTTDLDNVFNKMIFVNISAASISICFFGLAVKVTHGNALLLLKNVMVVIALIMPIFNLCYYAQVLKDASEGLVRSSYSTLWYEGDKRYMDAICFVIERCQKPCCLTSLKYNRISLITFTTVMSTTWSYFSLASTLYDEDAE